MPTTTKTDKPKLFTRSARFKGVLLRPGRAHGWKHHFTGSLAEVVGFLDYMAAKDHERFVWSTVNAIAARCRRFRGGKGYSAKAVEKDLEYLRAQLIVSPIVYRVRENQQGDLFKYPGRIIAPHDALTSVLKGRCYKRPLTASIKRGTVWTCEPGGTSWRGKKKKSAAYISGFKLRDAGPKK